MTNSIKITVNPVQDACHYTNPEAEHTPEEIAAFDEMVARYGLWGWCTVHVIASYEGIQAIEGKSSMGGCSCKGEEDFKYGQYAEYFEKLKERAIANLKAEVERLKTAIAGFAETSKPEKKFVLIYRDDVSRATRCSEPKTAEQLIPELESGFNPLSDGELILQGFQNPVRSDKTLELFVQIGKPGDYFRVSLNELMLCIATQGEMMVYVTLNIRDRGVNGYITRNPGQPSQHTLFSIFKDSVTDAIASLKSAIHQQGLQPSIWEVYEMRDESRDRRFVCQEEKGIIDALQEWGYLLSQTQEEEMLQAMIAHYPLKKMNDIEIALTGDEAHWLKYAILTTAARETSERKLYLTILEKLNKAEQATSDTSEREIILWARYAGYLSRFTEETASQAFSFEEWKLQHTSDPLDWEEPESDEEMIQSIAHYLLVDAIASELSEADDEERITREQYTWLCHGEEDAIAQGMQELGLNIADFAIESKRLAIAIVGAANKAWAGKLTVLDLWQGNFAHLIDERDQPFIRRFSPSILQSAILRMARRCVGLEVAATDDADIEYLFILLGIKEPDYFRVPSHNDALDAVDAIVAACATGFPPLQTEEFTVVTISVEEE